MPATSKSQVPTATVKISTFMIREGERAKTYTQVHKDYYYIYYYYRLLLHILSQNFQSIQQMNSNSENEGISYSVRVQPLLNAKPRLYDATECPLVTRYHSSISNTFWIFYSKIDTNYHEQDVLH